MSSDKDGDGKQLRLEQAKFDADEQLLTETTAKRDRILQDRREAVESLSGKLPPLEAFDLRLSQLLLKNPAWETNGRDEGGAESDDGTYRSIPIEFCSSNEALKFLEDPDNRYIFSGRVYWQKVYFGGHWYGTSMPCALVQLVPNEQPAEQHPDRKKAKK